jgi:hypothetical protein
MWGPKCHPSYRHTSGAPQLGATGTSNSSGTPMCGAPLVCLGGVGQPGTTVAMVHPIYGPPLVYMLAVTHPIYGARYQYCG